MNYVTRRLRRAYAAYRGRLRAARAPYGPTPVGPVLAAAAAAYRARGRYAAALAAVRAAP